MEIFLTNVRFQAHTRLRAAWWFKTSKNPCVSFILPILPIVIFWHLWKWRNSDRFQGKQLSLSSPISNILTDVQCMFNHHFKIRMSNVQTWVSFFYSISHMQRPLSFKVERWISPPHMNYKLNTYGCSKRNLGQSGSSVILRYSTGKLIFAFSYCFGEATSIQAKAKTFLHTVRYCL